MSYYDDEDDRLDSDAVHDQPSSTGPGRMGGVSLKAKERALYGDDGDDEQLPEERFEEEEDDQEDEDDEDDDEEEEEEIGPKGRKRQKVCAHWE